MKQINLPKKTLMAGLLLTAALCHTSQANAAYNTNNDTEYQAALAAIEDGKVYCITTTYENKAYYLTTSGTLTDNVIQAGEFTFRRQEFPETVSDSYGVVKQYSWVISPDATESTTRQRFTNRNSDTDLGIATTKRDLSTGSNSRFDSQVLYKNEEGFAIRSTNVTTSSWSSTRFWAVKTDNGNVVAYHNNSAPTSPVYSWDIKTPDEISKPKFVSLSGEYSIKNSSNGKYYIQKGINGSHKESYYMAFANESDIKADVTKNNPDFSEYRGSFTIAPVDATDASKGVRMYTDLGTLYSDGYIKKDLNNADGAIFYIVDDPDNSGKYAILNSSGQYWAGSTKWQGNRDITVTQNTPNYVFEFVNGDAIYGLLALSDANTASDFASGHKALVELARSLSADKWATICLPFSLTEEQVKATFGDGTTLAELTGFDCNTLNFDQTVKAMDANKPYLMKVGTAADKYYFTDVKTEQTTSLTDSKNGASFVGAFVKTNLSAGDYFISSNAIYRSQGIEGNEDYVNPFRGFFRLDQPSNAKSLVLNIGGETTGIDNIDGATANTANTIYDLCGRRIEAANAKHGIYIVGGKKIVKK